MRYLYSPTFFLGAAACAEVFCDPFGSGVRLLITFLATQTASVAMKFAVKFAAVRAGFRGKRAFWRRPSSGGVSSKAYETDSAGFPSSHVTITTAVWIFIFLRGTAMSMLLSTAVRAAVAAFGGLSMTAGRFFDGAHKPPQIFAGLILGTMCGILAAHLLDGFEIPTIIAAFILLAVPLFHVMASWKKYWRSHFGV